MLFIVFHHLLWQWCYLLYCLYPGQPGLPATMTVFYQTLHVISRTWVSENLARLAESKLSLTTRTSMTIISTQQHQLGWVGSQGRTWEKQQNWPGLDWESQVWQISDFLHYHTFFFLARSDPDLILYIDLISHISIMWKSRLWVLFSCKEYSKILCSK